MLSAINVGTLAKAIEVPDCVVTKVAEVTYTVFGPLVDSFDRVVRESAPYISEQLDLYFKSAQHPLSAKLPLMTWTYVIFAIFMYAVALTGLFIVAKVLGKQKYRFLGLIHNCFLFLLSLYMMVTIAITAIAAGYTVWNNGAGVDAAFDWPMAKILWVFYVSKLPEFVDTFLMVLKHNHRQISFLHLYHHSTIFVIWFVVVNRAPGGDAYWSAMANSGVHVVMYGYYFGTMLFESGPIRNLLNKFKFFITKGQMVQFAMNAVQSLYDLNFVEKLNYPPELIHLLFWYMLTLLALFGNFLLKNSNPKRINPAGSPTSPLSPQRQESKKRQ